jgi:catechol 2,3-dioxygenase-like lactoylglutathione lyase family enzyme
MLTGIDHVIVAVRELDTAITSYRQAGFTVVPGGEHPGQGTHNALVALGDGSYLELLAFHNENRAHRWYVPWQRGIGIVDVCLGSNDLDRDVEAYRRAGVTVGDAIDRHRVRPDGRRVEWRLAVPHGLCQRAVPFLIQDVTPRDVRVPAERVHANGVTGLHAVTIATRDLAITAKWYGALGEGQPVVRPDVGGEGLRFAVGQHQVDLVAPSTAGSPLHGWLAEHGAGAYMAALRGTAGTGLDATLLHGARLAVV